MTNANLPVRYGVYLRPSPSFGRLVAEAFGVVHKQFGLREAGSYPPHVTLAGSIALKEDEQTLIDRLDRVLSGRHAITVHNRGLRVRHGDGIGYDLNGTEEGSANEHLQELASDLIAAVRPLRVFPESDWDHEFRVKDGVVGFEAHLTLVGRELMGTRQLRDEVLEFLIEAGFSGPSHFRGDTVSVYRLRARDWSSDYWQSMTWEHVRSWRLSDGRNQPT